MRHDLTTFTSARLVLVGVVVVVGVVVDAVAPFAGGQG